MAFFITMTLMAPVVLGGLVVAGVLLQHRHVAGAADLAALAGAGALVRGGDACAAAERITRANQVDLSSCEIDGRTVYVKVDIEATTLFGIRYPVRAAAHAGVPAG
jgi:secretion/DNA translocation related TadE-like protein